MSALSFTLPPVSLLSASRALAHLDPEYFTGGALLVALAYSVRSTRQSNLSPRNMYWGVVLAILGGLWGGHLLDLLVHGWQNGLLAFFQFWQGGKSYFGGLIGGGITGGLFFYYRKLPILVYADASMPALALGYAVGRLGCFVNGDDYGTVCRLPWAVVFPMGTEAYDSHVSRGWISPDAMWSLPVHPVQLYASLLGLCLFIWFTNWNPALAGSRFCAFVASYGAARFVMEWLRGDFRMVLGPLSLPPAGTIPGNTSGIDQL